MQSIYDFFVFASSVEIELERSSGRRTYKRKIDVIELDSPCMLTTDSNRGLVQRCPNVGATVPTLGQRWTQPYCCLGHHGMEPLSAILALCVGHQWIPPQRGPSIKSFDVFYVVSLNKLWNKQSTYR